MQSSHATIVLILAALSVGQITYENAIALTIGANIGTTITAIIGSLSSNIDGKRLAGAHFIFNVVTATITVAIFYQIIDVVNIIADYIGIAPDNHTLRLAVFDSLFKIMGVIVFIPFVGMLVRFLERTFTKKETAEVPQVDTAEFLNDSALEFPSTTLKATLDESKRLLDNAMKIIANALGVHTDKLFSDQEIDTVFSDPCCISTIDVEEAYHQKLKGIYGEIVEFVIRAQSNMEEEYINSYHNIKLANRNTIEAVKMTEQLQHNLSTYLKSDNIYIKEQYIKMIKRIAKLLRRIYLISQTEDKENAMKLLQKTKSILVKNDIVANGKLDKLIRGNHIDHVMAASLMNDSAYTNNIIKSLIVTTGVLWINPATDIVVYREEIFRDKK
jgi:phosphate:Na+ symporter